TATVAAASRRPGREVPFRLAEALFSTVCGRIAHHQSTSPDLGVTERRQSLPSDAKKVEKGTYGSPSNSPLRRWRLASPARQNHWQRMQFAAKRIECQTECFERKRAEEIAVARLAED